MSTEFRFAVPAAAGLELQTQRRLGAYLESRLQRRCSVLPVEEYDALAAALLSGAVDAGWAPPVVCAKLELQRAPIVLRSIRHGVATYRAAIVVRTASAITVDSVGAHRAAWTDRDSVAGYRLALGWLRARRERAQARTDDLFVGSYRAALQALLDERADVASVYAASGREKTGLQEIWPEKEHWFRVLAFTDDAPNDGIAATASLEPALREKLRDAFLALPETAYGDALLNECFHAERFEDAPAGGYRALYRGM